MKRTFQYHDLEKGLVTVTEDEIRETWFPSWIVKMHACGGGRRLPGTSAMLLTFDDALADWIAVHWAWEVVQ